MKTAKEEILEYILRKIEEAPADPARFTDFAQNIRDMIPLHPRIKELSEQEGHEIAGELWKSWAKKFGIAEGNQTARAHEEAGKSAPNKKGPPTSLQ